MTERLTHKQTAVLFTLMAFGTELSNPRLQEIGGFVLDGKDRLRLNDLNLVTSRKTGRSLSHRLTDDGWAWCEEELAAGSVPPPRPRSLLAVVMYLVFSRLDEYRRAQGLRLADLFPEPDQDQEPEQHPQPEQLPEPDGTGGDLESAVRRAYAELVRKPGGWVSLVNLRAQVPASKPELDDVLVAMSGDGRVHLAAEENRKALTPEAKAAAVRIGNGESHLIKVEVP